jgi:hypothetical protein
MGLGYQAVNVKAPEFRVTGGDGQPNTVSSVKLFTFDVTHKVHELPERFWGKYVSMTAVGGDCQYVFTDKATHEVDSSITATDAGTENEKLGGIIFSGTERQRRVPNPPQGGKVYFSREGTAAGSVRIELSSD